MPRADKAAFIQNMLSELELKRNGSAPTKPEPDSKEWWREVAQGLGAEVNRERARAEAAEQQVAELRAERERLRAVLVDVRAHIELGQCEHSCGLDESHDDGTGACWACAENVALSRIDAALEPQP